ncbi:MAG: hypothetical protein HOI84_01500 [Flavobacteriaceae bacterium]|nr:hypothetical protein [Flavobacteriaceae bacterium]
MKPFLSLVTLALLCACSSTARTTSSTFMGITQVENPPFEVRELSMTPWAAGREEGGTGYLFKLTLSEPFATLDSIYYNGNTTVWKRDTSQPNAAVYTANQASKNHPKKNLILDGNSQKEYGNTPPIKPTNQAAIFYRKNNRPQVYLVTEIKRLPTINYM